MEIGQKPFECPDTKCDMSFANADHLEVHMKKHELSLALTPTTLLKNYFADQTPTPSRFLNGLEPDLFQDFHNDNPFDATFRKANTSNSGSCNLLLPESSTIISHLPDTEVLNTPSITLPETPVIFKSIFVNRKQEKVFLKSPPTPDNTESLPFSPVEHVRQDSGNLLESFPESNSRTVKGRSSELNLIEGVAKEKKRISKSFVAQTPVIMSVGNSSVLRPANTSASKAVATTRPANTTSPVQATSVNDNPGQIKNVESNQAVVQSVSVTPMLQVMIRLPDGQTMPVQLPVLSSAPFSVAPTQPVQCPPSPVEPLPPVSVPSSAKMKLKEVLTLNAKTGVKGNGSAPKVVRPNLVRILPDQTVSDILNSYDLNSPPLSPVHRPQSGRKRRDAVGNPDEKRKKCLERNRAAATRCRVKKKLWINSLEHKAEELSKTNVQLQIEVSNLRNEVAQLKTMLLAHKDCPVTQQQRDCTFSNDRGSCKSYTTVHVVHESLDDSQCVPNAPMGGSEYMEVEMGSVQSSSDGSLASDNSDSSFKER